MQKIFESLLGTDILYFLLSMSRHDGDGESQNGDRPGPWASRLRSVWETIGKIAGFDARDQVRKYMLRHTWESVNINVMKNIFIYCTF